MEQTNPADTDLKMPEENFGPQPTETESNSHLVLILAALIVILTLLLGGLYIWSTTGKAPQPTNEGVETSDIATTSTEILDDSTIPADVIPTATDQNQVLQDELNNIDLDALDADLNSIEAEIDAALLQ